MVLQGFSRDLNFKEAPCRMWKEGQISEEELTKMQLGRSMHTNKIETVSKKNEELYRNMNAKKRGKWEFVYYLTEDW